MKTLNMEITLQTYANLSDNGQLNPTFIKEVLYSVGRSKVNSLPKLKQPTVKYALKIDNDIHREFKQWALDEQTTLSELSGRLFENQYNEVD